MREDNRSFKGNARLDRLPLPESGRVRWKDAGSAGLYLSISASGRRAWVCQLKVDGKPTWRTLGYYHPDGGMTLAQARAAVGGAKGRVQAKLDAFPHLEDRGFPAVWKRFTEQHLPRLKQRSGEAHRSLRRRIGTSWDNKLIDHISANDCADLIALVAKLAKASAKGKSGGKAAENNTYACLNTFFRWCWKRELIENIPTKRLDPPNPNIVRDRLLRPEEVVAIWNALETETQFPWRSLVRFAILVPCRIWSEVAQIKRTDVIDGRWVYRVPKTDAKQVLPLPRMVLDMLEQCPNLGEYYFGMKAISATPKTELKRRVDAHLDLEPWVFHDLRRAFMTHLRELGVPFDLVDQIQRPLAHRDTAGGKHYDLSVRPDEKGEVLEYWAYVLTHWIAGGQPIRWREWLNHRDAQVAAVETSPTRAFVAVPSDSNSYGCPIVGNT